MRVLTFVAAAALVIAAPAAQPRDKTLNIYVVDVEGGNATLFVAPSGGAVLIDTGNGGQAVARDVDRIMAAVKDAGLTQIDHLVTTHWHGDHFGGLAELANRLPIRHFVDHGANIQPAAAVDEFLNKVYPAVSAKSKRTVVKPGDTLPLQGLDWRIVTAAGNVLQSPLPGAGAANPLCASYKPQDADKTENAQSVGSVVTFGRFRVVHLGDLTWNKEFDLMCPMNRIGTADLFVVSHHGQPSSNSPQLVHALESRAAIINNGTRKGGQPDAMRVIHSAPRLEDVVSLVSARLGLACNVLSTPTSIVMSFSDPAREDDLAEITQVVRVAPGEVNLKRLCLVDEIADQVIDGRLDLAAGRRRLRELGLSPRSRGWRAAHIASFGISAASIAAILHTTWAGVVTAGVIGVVIGLVYNAASRRPQLGAAAETLAGFLATMIAIAIAVHVTPLAVRSVVIASLIVLMPGMALTTAVRELSSQHLISGTARTMGALATLLKLAFGTIAATQLCALIGWVPSGNPGVAVPPWIDWIAVLAGGCAFAVLFGSPRRYVPVVVAAVMLGFATARLGGAHLSPAFGVFLGGAVVGAASNVFARVMQRPGALVREPGIILLVPGSVGFRTLSFVFERDVLLGIDTAITLVTLLVAIVAGLLIGDLLVPPRRKL